MTCDFIRQLGRLRKSSLESVENIDSFDQFKNYLHVERQIEFELKGILRNARDKQSKCLILLCGSAGDGKSHMISYLKNHDKENLLEEFQLYNDATESSEPTLTSIDTLANELNSFSDYNLDNNDDKKIIIAINLGTLNNFIESEKGQAFSRLKDYVVNNGIFSGYSDESSYKEGSPFQHVSFSDYQVFSLGPNGYETDFLNALIEKIFCESEENPYYQSYLSCSNCSLSSRCPVRHNYMFLSDFGNQQYVIKRIVESVIKDKAIVSTREVLNLIYDLIVHPEFNPQRISIGSSDIQFLTNYIGWTTPMLLNEYEDISLFLNILRTHDVLKERTDKSDEDAMRFHSMMNIQDVFSESTNNTPYQVLNELTDVHELGGIKPELKKLLYRFITRLRSFRNLSACSKEEERFNEYIEYLYYQNTQNERKLSKLYESTRKAILHWNGKFDDDNICIDDSNEKFWILEQLQLAPVPQIVKPKTETVIQRFSPTIRLRFKKDGTDDNSAAELRIDYALFELISDMKEGYRPTVKDKNLHTDFASYVQQVIEYGNKARKIALVPKDDENNKKYMFEKNSFGYEFKAV